MPRWGSGMLRWGTGISESLARGWSVDMGDWHW